LCHFGAPPPEKPDKHKETPLDTIWKIEIDEGGLSLLQVGLLGCRFLGFDFYYLASLVSTAGRAGAVRHDLGMALRAFHQRWCGPGIMRIVDSSLCNAASSFW
jgi:hypothetical protein